MKITSFRSGYGTNVFFKDFVSNNFLYKLWGNKFPKSQLWIVQQKKLEGNRNWAL